MFDMYGLIFGFIFFLGNRSRGQADGFGIEILAKLRDVKTKVLSMYSLLSTAWNTVLNHIS